MAENRTHRTYEADESGEALDQSDRYTVVLTDEAFYAYSTLQPERLFQHVDHDLELLESFPNLGRTYDPAYPAAQLPFVCRVLYCEHMGIYYRVDATMRELTVLAIEDQRQNPMSRFSAYEYYATRFDSELPETDGDA